MPTEVKGSITNQLIATAGGFLLINQIGLIIGWVPPNLARLTQPNAAIPLTLTEVSWLMPAYQLGKFVSVFLAPISIELAGSRIAVLCTFVPMSVSWLLTMFADSVTWLYVARFLGGTSDGAAQCCYSLFFGEVSCAEHRGTSIAIALVGGPVGIVVATVAETYAPSVSCAVYLVPCLLGILLFAWLPESPYRLVKIRRMDGALAALAWYRGHSEVDEEMKEISEFVESTGRVTFVEKLRKLRSPPVSKAVFLISLIFMLPQVCGVTNIFCYMQIILTSGKSYLVDPSRVSIYTSVILLVSTIVTINFSDKLGRRVLLIASCAVIATSQLGLGLHFYLLNNAGMNLQGLPIASIIALLVAYVTGMTPVTDTLLGEMFPAGVRTTTATIALLVSSFAGVISAKTYQPLIDTIGEIYLFWMYAAFMALAVPVLLILLPETKGKSLQEIQNDLYKK